MKVAKIIRNTKVEGPGNRAAFWLQGCSIKCDGCCNPELISFSGGLSTNPVTLAQKLARIKNDGVTILGGEPLDQSDELLKFVYEYKKLSNKSLILFTGYTWEKIDKDSIKKQVINQCDLVVAGPFVKSQKSSKRRWIGSDNQTTHFISEKLNWLRNKWKKDLGEIEITITDDAITINGAAIDFLNHNKQVEF